MDIIYEDNHIIAVNKNCHEIVQGDKTGDTPLADTLKVYLKDKYAKPGNVFVGVVHRLDRPVTGVALFARTSKALSRLNELFRNGDVHKTYWAIVPASRVEQRSLPPDASSRYDASDATRPTLYDTISVLSPKRQTLVNWLVRNEKQNKSYAYDIEQQHSKKAVLHFKSIARSERYCLLEIELETGRHHQIRAQLAKAGYPIKGDLKYGSKRSNPDGGICLHARSVRFTHPVSQKELTITAQPPDDMLWQQLLATVSDP